MPGHAALLRQEDPRSDGTVGSVAPAAPRPRLLDALAQRRLIWLPEVGVGYYPVEAGAAPYDADYFARYAAMAQTEMGVALNALRIKMVERHWSGELVDVGIGSGSFVEARPSTFGYDINVAGKAWLGTRGLYRDPYIHGADAISLWDVLEHIPDFSELLAKVRRYVFVALPVFRDAEDVRCSKHFRRDEHCWYFTEWGLMGVMAELGWKCVEVNDDEISLGRQAIASFAFRRGRR